ncbi:MAG: HEAT repeat domain-containing protein [Verrucomicrobia bacterium]|nr:HEAT repeat domain-containing protein [Verrucomicrobiota bacterium]
MSDIRAAAAEAAAVEELAEAAPLAEEGVREPARETVRPSRAPLRTEADGETPFEFVIEPRALVPGRIEFVRSSDEVLFNRAIDSLGSRDARGMREGLQMLGRIPGETAAAVLRNLYSIAPARWRSEVAHQLVNHAAPGIKEFFREVLDRHDEPAVVRVAALRALYARDKALATEYLLKALGDESDDVRAAAATYVGWLREKRAMPLLEQLVGDRSSVVATAALRAAASIRL